MLAVTTILVAGCSNVKIDSATEEKVRSDYETMNEIATAGPSDTLLEELSKMEEELIRQTNVGTGVYVSEEGKFYYVQIFAQ